ncbi:MAG: response regulator [Alphaproteobacteria bacterium]|nr:response regulator [Alphaproteobacteria bacterium]
MGWTARHSGAEFMARYPESHPHRIVLDLALPDHDGMELLKFLADRKCAADIILVSSHGKSMLDQAMKLGDLHRLNMHRMPPKPFSLDDLKAARRLDPG